MSKTFRLAQSARDVIDAVPRFEVDFLDLSVRAAEYGRVIYPCKACVSTAMPLCHWRAAVIRTIILASQRIG